MKGMKNPFDSELNDFEFIEKADFHSDVKLVAQSAVASLPYLKKLAAERGIPMEQITGQLIIEELAKPAAQMREHQRKFLSREM